MNESETGANNRKTVEFWEKRWEEFYTDIQSLVLECQSLVDPVPPRELYVGEKIIVGRNTSADLRVTGDDRMSMIHFSLECRKDRGTIHDLGSTNGTYVNGKRVKHFNVADRDIIVAGSTAFRVRFVNEP